MVQLKSLFVTILLLPLPTLADVLFEGYSKIISGGVHVGYVISRYEFDTKTKHFVSTYYVKTGALGSDISESLRAVSDAELKPVSYEYTALVGKNSKMIDAKFNKNRMTAVVTEGKNKPKTIVQDLSKDAFLSSFLVYVILKSKTGLRTGTKYEYIDEKSKPGKKVPTAIAEEDAEAQTGMAYVDREETHRGFRAFRVLNEFKGEKFISYITDRGETLSTNAPNGIATELVARPADAVGNFGTSSLILKKLFGEVPKGTDNIVSKAALDAALNPPAEGGKGQGVPPGQGIVIKAEPAPQPQQGKGK